MPKAQLKPSAVNEVSVTLPLGEIPATTWGIHIDTRLNVVQSTALRRIAAGLDQSMVRLASGARVVSANDALKFLLEKCGENPVAPDAPGR